MKSTIEVGKISWVQNGDSDSNGRFFFSDHLVFIWFYIWFDRDNTGILMGNGGSSHFFNGSSNGFRHYFNGSQLAYLLGL